MRAMKTVSLVVNGLPEHASVASSKVLELVRKLLEQISQEELQVGDRLGTEIELSRRYGVSRAVIRKALSVLQRDGFLSRKRKTGTIVTRTPDRAYLLGLTRGTVAVICPNQLAEHPEEDSALLRILHVLDNSLAHQGLVLQLIGVGRDPEADRLRLRQLRHQPFLLGVCSPWGCVEAYEDCLPDVPVVVTGFFSRRFPLVGVDIRDACRMAIRYLLSRGHQATAMICGDWNTPEVFALFAEGYRDAFAQAGLTYNRSLLYLAHKGESLGDLTREVLTRDPPPTAVFVDHYRLCEAVVRVANELGFRIPQDLSLVGYGENILRFLSPVPLTSYVPDNQKLAEDTARLLSDMINGEAAPERPIFVQGKLVEGKSVRQMKGATRDREKRTSDQHT